MKKLLIIPIIFSILLSSCSTRFLTLNQIIESNKLVVTTNAEFAPFEYKKGSKLIGIDIEIVEAYASYLGIELEIKDLDFDAALLSVSTGKADLAIAAITTNDKRKEVFDFSNSYYYANQVIIVKENSIYESCTSKEDVLETLSNNKAIIGCQRGTTGQYYIEGDSSWGFDGIANSTCKAFDNGSLAVKALANGQIDAVIIDEVPASLYCKNFNNVKPLDFVFTQEEYAIAVCKGNTTLVDSLNEFIDKIRKDGTFDSIVGKYYA